jgi:hypothetical protein
VREATAADPSDRLGRIALSAVQVVDLNDCALAAQRPGFASSDPPPRPAAFRRGWRVYDSPNLLPSAD